MRPPSSILTQVELTDEELQAYAEHLRDEGEFAEETPAEEGAEEEARESCASPARAAFHRSLEDARIQSAPAVARAGVRSVCCRTVL